MACKHSGGSSWNTQEIKIGNEWVKFRDRLCNNCGTILERQIIGRRPA